MKLKRDFNVKSLFASFRPKWSTENYAKKCRKMLESHRFKIGIFIFLPPIDNRNIYRCGIEYKLIFFFHFHFGYNFCLNSHFDEISPSFIVTIAWCGLKLKYMNYHQWNECSKFLANKFHANCLRIHFLFFFSKIIIELQIITNINFFLFVYVSMHARNVTNDSKIYFWFEMFIYSVFFSCMYR